MADFAVLAAAALARSDDLVPRWLPEGRRQGAEWVARNPTRADLHPGSFSINLHTGRWADFATGDRGGDLLGLRAYLFHGGDTKVAARALQEELDLPAPVRSVPVDADGAELCRPVPSNAPTYLRVLEHGRFGSASNHWLYRGRSGELLMVVVRWDTADGKEIRQFTCWRMHDGSLRWLPKWIDAPRPLYGLDRLATTSHYPVVVCEGEKACDAAAQLLPEYVATTAPGGAAAADSADWSPLRGRRVVIWPDADEPGSRYASTVAAACRAIGAREVALLDLDWLADVRDRVVGGGS
jgi:hypothetical protein